MSSTPTPRDKRTSLDEAVSRLSSGMTIGIGGWGSRRKPMALVRAILRREDLTDLTVISFGGPDLDRLFITTSRENLPDDEEPAAGSIYAVEPGVRGMQPLAFGG